MNSSQVFIGNIKRCTKYETHTTFKNEAFLGDDCIGCDSFGYIEEESETFKENAVLIQVINGGYVDVESYKSAIDYFKVRKDIQGKGFRLGGLILSTSPHRTDCLFVDSSSLRPYYQQEENKTVSVRQLRKTLAGGPGQAASNNKAN